MVVACCQLSASLTLGKYIGLGLGISLYMMICLYIYLCHVAVLLTLILTLYLRSSPLLQSQTANLVTLPSPTANLVTLPSPTANLVTLPSPTARPVPILRQNVLTSVITSTPQKTNNTLIKREFPHQILVMTMGYILANCSFCTGRIETFNTAIMNITS